MDTGVVIAIWVVVVMVFIAIIAAIIAAVSVASQEHRDGEGDKE